MFAQGAALAFGRTADEVAEGGVDPDLVPHRTFPGNRPSTTILLDELSPRAVGAGFVHSSARRARAARTGSGLRARTHTIASGAN